MAATPAPYPPLPLKQKVLPLVRDARPIEEKVKDGFLHVEPEITSRTFRAAVAEESAPREAVLLNFGEYVFTEGVLSQLERMELRAGLPTELVDLSKSVPNSKELAASLPLIALGDSWEGPLGNLLVVFLVGDARNRALSLHWRGGGWNEDYWFLAFKRTASRSG